MLPWLPDTLEARDLVRDGWNRRGEVIHRIRTAVPLLWVQWEGDPAPVLVSPVDLVLVQKAIPYHLTGERQGVLDLGD